MALSRYFLFCMAMFVSLSEAHLAQAQSLPVLHRGLNISSWLANAPRQPLFARDFNSIKQAGFDHIRLPFNPEYVGFKLQQDFGKGDGGNVAHVDFTKLDRALDEADQYGLPVIIDLHPSGEFVDTLEKYPWAEDEFVALWKTMAERYKPRSSTKVIFELLNEPQYYKTEARWTKLVERLTAAIRAVSEDRLIVVGAPHGSDIDGLSYLQTSADPYTIYAFHFYEPYLVTHQGIHMGFEKKMIRAFRNLPYPSDLATKPASTYAPDAKNPAEAQNELSEYLETPWKGDHISQRIGIAHEWASEHEARLLCGEFGVLRNHIDAASRYRWISDTRTALDKSQLGWELWDYADLFGIAVPQGATATDPVDGAVTPNDPAKSSYVFEPAALKALGLAGAGAFSTVKGRAALEKNA